MKLLEIWQEIDCPSGSDWDLDTDEMVYQGQRFKCPDCGGEHVANESFISTYTVTDVDGERTFGHRSMPKDAEELAAWRDELKP